MTTIIIYDGWNSIAEYGIASSTYILQTSYTWGTDLSGTLQGAGGVGGLLSVNKTGTNAGTYFPTYDGNGNISEYLTSAGTTAAHFEYDPFGNTTVNTDTGYLFKYRFSTKPLDTESGLYYYGYRYYDPVTGRWPNRDPIEEAGGINLYGMVRNDPVGFMDVLGGHPARWPMAVGRDGNGNPVLKNKDGSMMTHLPSGQFADFNSGSLISKDQLRGIRANNRVNECCGPDATEWLVNQMNKNRDHPVIKTAREVTWPRYVPGVNLGWTAGALSDFTDLVKKDGPWDFKKSQKFSTTSCPTGGCKKTITLCGICFYYDLPGNIHYGYVGAAAGFRDWLLYAAAGSVQPGGNGDDPVDAVAISIGIDLWENGGNLCDKIQANKAKLSADQWRKDMVKNCAPCKDKY